jgi:hypothetical protein
VRCLVMGCENKTDQGRFVGDLCAPCHQMLITGVAAYGNTFVHKLAEENLKYQRLKNSLLETLAMAWTKT